MTTTFTADDASRIAYEIFVAGRADVPSLQPGAEEPEEIVPGQLYRLAADRRYATRDQDEASGGPVWLYLYPNLGKLGGELWQRHTRTLHRVGTRGNQGLPAFHGGGTVEHNEAVIGYAVSESRPYDLSMTGAMATMAARPERAFPEFARLLDALRALHEEGVIHRSIWPGAIESNDELQLQLSRFETAALMENVLHHRHIHDASVDDLLASAFVAQGDSAVLHAAPERLKKLFPVGAPSEYAATDHVNEDVFSLGMVGAQWFAGVSLDDVRVLRDGPKGPELDWRRWQDAVGGVRRQVRMAPELPRPMRALLLSMLEERANVRRTSAEAVERLAAVYDLLDAAYFDRKSEPHLVAYSPKDFRDVLYKKWGFVSADPSTPEGAAELARFIVDDTRGGVLEYSPLGYSPINNDNRAEYREAVFVLRGLKVAWFGRLYEQKNPFTGVRTAVPNALMITQALNLRHRGRTKRYRPAPYTVRLPELRLVEKDSTVFRGRGLHQRPSWEPLLERVAFSTGLRPEHQQLHAALSWLLHYQQTEIRARRYAFTRVAHDKQAGYDSDHVVLRYDRARDTARLDRDAHLELYSAAPQRRPPFGEFLDTLSDRNIGSIIELRRDEEGQMGRRDRRAVLCQVIQKRDQHEIVVRRLPESPPIPSTGWAFPQEDEAARRQLMRQEEALGELQTRTQLMTALTRPKSLLPKNARWNSADLKGLRGESSRRVVRDMLDYRPSYAVHGPPGAGKTTVTAHALRLKLKSDPAARVLVSAQSHHALDNLTEKVAELLGDSDHTLARVASRHTLGSVHGRARRFLPSEQAARRVQEVQRRCDRLLQRGEVSGALAGVVAEWRATVETSQLELMDRTLRGANIVFSTCAASTDEILGTGNPFDWAIIEEAARAWPTEVLVPLVRANRWCLIGDPKQLPAFRKEEILRFLDDCEKDPRPSLNEHGRQKAAYKKVFEYFTNLFPPPGTPAPRRGELVDHPSGVLKRQFRMRKPIADLIDQAFYDNILETDEGTERPHGVRIPGLLADDHPLLWLDTGESAFEDRERRGPWTNPGEVAVLQRLLSTWSLPPSQADRVAILAPYRKQVQLLEQELPAPYRERVSTIDAFQGREADIVLISMTRSRPKPWETSKSVAPHALVGHLTSRERINVLFSRARTLQVVIGNHRHLRDARVGFLTELALAHVDRRRVRSVEGLTG